MLKGHSICALVYDSNVNVNYSPLNGNLMGANLGIVAFQVLDVRRRFDGSTSSLPRVTIEIQDAGTVCADELFLFANAPVPQSSAEPFDIDPPDSPGTPIFVPAP